MLETYKHLKVGRMRKILCDKLQYPLNVSVINVIIVMIIIIIITSAFQP